MAAAVIATGGLGAGIAAAVSHEHTHHSSYGGLPSYLAAAAETTDATLQGSSQHPALTSEGDEVRVRLPHGQALVEVSGPVVPGEGLPYQATADTATWTVTVSHVTGRIPLQLKDFTTIDSLGVVYHPAFVIGAHRPPHLLRHGQTAKFELRAVMAVGEGMMRWAPVNNDLVATWDFVVEND